MCGTKADDLSAWIYITRCVEEDAHVYWALNGTRKATTQDAPAVVRELRLLVLVERYAMVMPKQRR